jgi:hypothetical protein
MDMEYEVSGAGGFGIFGIIWLAVMVLMLVSLWKVFTKAGQPGWGVLIPFYNLYLMLTIAGKPAWWIILFFVPIANLVVGILTLIGLAQNFGKGGGFVVGMIFLPIIFYPILAFGDATYRPQPPAVA